MKINLVGGPLNGRVIDEWRQPIPKVYNHLTFRPVFDQEGRNLSHYRMVKNSYWLSKNKAEYEYAGSEDV